MPAFLTTRATQWSRRMPGEASKWTDRGDGFNVEYGEEEALPLEHLELIAAAGHGGCVEKWRYKGCHKIVAIKRMETHSNKKDNGKLSDEVNILRQVRHYHSVRILGSFTHRDWFNIIMEPAAHCDLRTYLMCDNSSMKMRIMERLCGPRMDFLPTIMGCLAHGLLYIHKETSVRHRDVKPANILLYGCRVLYADFGLSKAFTETHSGTSGPSAKTVMYTSPERARNHRRNKSCDIFSLACVFAEIFTVYKGRNLDDFYNCRRESDEEGDGYYHRTVPATMRWLESLVTERCDVQILRLLRAMFSVEPAHRPDAEYVWKVLTNCTTTTKQFFCSPCCMPLLYNDPLLDKLPVTDPITTANDLRVSSPSAAPITRDLYFRTKYENDGDLGMQWVRNLRQWEHSTLDVVAVAPHLLARKRITSLGNDLGSMLAMNEAEILRKASHRHIVRLHSTYRQGEDIYGLLYEPAAQYDLRSYMELAEIQMNLGKNLPVDLRFLTRSLGCLASAMARVHGSGYDHGDIRPENILIHEDMIFLSKFSHGLRSEGTGSPTMQRFIDAIGRLDIGRRPSRGSANGSSRPTSPRPCSPRPTNPAAGYYKPPEWRPEEPTSIGQPMADIFSLGCVFLEVYTVLQGRRIREFVDFRIDELGRSDYRYTNAKALEWMALVDGNDHPTKDLFQGVLKRMLDSDSEKRPTAQDVHRTLRECYTYDGVPRCGEFCCP